jgi:hypothetical protein
MQWLKLGAQAFAPARDHENLCRLHGRQGSCGPNCFVLSQQLQPGASGETGFNIVPPLKLVSFAQLPAE